MRSTLSRRAFACGLAAAALLPGTAFGARPARFIGCIDFDAVRRHLRAPSPPPAPAVTTGAVAASASELAAESALRREEAELAQVERAVAVRKYLWDKGTRLGVSLLGGTARQRQRVTAYAPVWSQYSGLALTFVPTPDGDIRVSFDAGALSYSAIGTEATTLPVAQPTMTLAQLADDLPEAQARSLVLHEFGHALGLVHEHQSPAAGVPWNKPAAYRYFGAAPFYLSPSEIDQQILTPYDETVTNHTQFDSQSIMVYPIPASITDGQFQVTMNVELSPLDKSFIASQYR
jgi:hypothetical protein